MPTPILVIWNVAVAATHLVDLNALAMPVGCCKASTDASMKKSVPVIPALCAISMQSVSSSTALSVVVERKKMARERLACATMGTLGMVTTVKMLTSAQQLSNLIRWLAKPTQSAKTRLAVLNARALKATASMMMGHVGMSMNVLLNQGFVETLLGSVLTPSVVSFVNALSDCTRQITVLLASMFQSAQTASLNVVNIMNVWKDIKTTRACVPLVTRKTTLEPPKHYVPTLMNVRTEHTVVLSKLPAQTPLEATRALATVVMLMAI